MRKEESTNDAKDEEKGRCLKLIEELVQNATVSQMNSFTRRFNFDFIIDKSIENHIFHKKFEDNQQRQSGK